MQPTAPTLLNEIAAEEMVRLQGRPLFNVEYIALLKSSLIIGGLSLAPNGDYAEVSVSGEDGVVFNTEFGLPHETAARTYWYWPNADRCSFRITIDLAATQHWKEYFTFRFIYNGIVQDEDEAFRTILIIPKNLNSFQNFPGDGALRRVHAASNVANSAILGLTTAAKISDLSLKHGIQRTNASVLDWGCGHGRVIRHFREIGFGGSLYGIDIDPENIEWASKNLPSIEFSTGPLTPPTACSDDQFDLIFGISVMTHLAIDVQKLWLRELKRILKPTGICILTYAGDASVAFSSKFIDDKWLSAYQRDGVGPYLGDKSLLGVIENHDYYKNVHQSIENAANMASEFFEPVQSIKCLFGYQDCLVLKKRMRKHTRARWRNWLSPRRG